MARRTPEPTDKLQLAEVAELLQVTYASAKTMRSRGAFPPAEEKFGRTPWWYRYKVEQWKKDRAERSA